MKTKVFKSYEDFLERANKNINGVSEDFAAEHPDFENQNRTNLGCWNCYSCYYCFDCNSCNSCKLCNSCNYCELCYECNYCNNCVSCYSCYACNNRENCVEIYEDEE